MSAGLAGSAFLENLQLAHGDELRSPEFIVCSDSIRPETCQTIIPPPYMIRRSTISDFDTGLTAGLTAGIDLASTFRGELEFVFSNNTIVFRII